MERQVQRQVQYREIRTGLELTQELNGNSCLAYGGQRQSHA